jgi:hypothetical protein
MHSVSDSRIPRRRKLLFRFLTLQPHVLKTTRETQPRRLTFRFSGRALSYQNWQFIHHGPLQPVVMPHDA